MVLSERDPHKSAVCKFDERAVFINALFIPRPFSLSLIFNRFAFFK
jgi:hypothetical protein